MDLKKKIEILECMNTELEHENEILRKKLQEIENSNHSETDGIENRIISIEKEWKESLTAIKQSQHEYDCIIKELKDMKCFIEEMKKACKEKRCKMSKKSLKK